MTPPPTPPPFDAADLLKISHAARELRVTRQTVYAMIERNDLTSVSVSGVPHVVRDQKFADEMDKRRRLNGEHDDEHGGTD